MDGARTRTKKKSKPEVVTSRLQIEMVPLSKLREWPGNPKEHDLDTIGESFERFGYIEPIVLDEKSKRIVVGHGRREKLIAWKESGKMPPEDVEVRGKEWFVPVLRGKSFKSEHEAEAYLLTSNQTVIRGGYNATALAEMLSRHVDDAHGTGWRAEEMSDLVALAQKATQGAFNDASAPEEFKDFDEGQKATHQCPKCGFPVVCGN
jgi:hypothetical protein